jgi:hypothetical protein
MFSRRPKLSSRREQRRFGSTPPALLAADAGSTRFQKPYTTGLFSIVRLVGTGEWFGNNFTATIQIVDGYAKCRDDNLTGNIVVVDTTTNTIVVAGPADTTSRHDSQCGDAIPVYNTNKTKLKTLSPPPPFYAEQGKTYTIGISYSASTDDTCEFTWQPVYLVYYGSMLAVQPGANVDLGNRVNKKVDQFANFYVKVATFRALDSYIVLPSTTGKLELGDGSGHDELTGRLVIKEGVASTGQPVAAVPTIYEGPMSSLAERRTDGYFSFTYDLNQRIGTTPGAVYTIMVKLYLDVGDKGNDTDDTIRVKWPSFAVGFSEYV